MHTNIIGEHISSSITNQNHDLIEVNRNHIHRKQRLCYKKLKYYLCLAYDWVKSGWVGVLGARIVICIAPHLCGSRVYIQCWDMGLMFMSQPPI